MQMLVADTSSYLMARRRRHLLVETRAIRDGSYIHKVACIKCGAMKLFKYDSAYTYHEENNLKFIRDAWNYLTVCRANKLITVVYNNG